MEIQWSDLESADNEDQHRSVGPEEHLGQMNRWPTGFSSDGEYNRIADNEIRNLDGAEILPNPEEIIGVKQEPNQMQNPSPDNYNGPNQPPNNNGQNPAVPPTNLYGPGPVTTREIPFEELALRPTPATSQAPSMDDYPGPWNFNFKIPTATKSRDPHYSKELNKLFLRARSGVKIQFQIKPDQALLAENGKLPQGVCIRAVMVFTNQASFIRPVKTCDQHALNNMGQLRKALSLHVIRAVPEDSAKYLQDSVSGRMCVMTPVTEIPPGENWLVPKLYQFFDWSSCVGGINRRDTAVIFTLEFGGNIIGRKVLPVRICTCIKRDMQIELDTRRKNMKKEAEKNENSPMTKKPMWVLAYGEEDYAALSTLARRLAEVQGVNVTEWDNQMRRMNMSAPSGDKKRKMEK